MILKLTSQSQILRVGGGSNHFGEKLYIFGHNKKIKPYQNDDVHVLNKKGGEMYANAPKF